MQIETWPIDKLIPYAQNPRINDESVDAVAASIKAFGFRQPIVVDDDHVIIVGHTRMKAARRLGLTEVPVHVATGLTEAQRKAYRIMDNRAGEASQWDPELLSIEMGELQDAEFDLDLTGFDADSLDELLEDDQDEETPTDDGTYTTEIKIPIYEPKNEKPDIVTLFDAEKTAQLVADITASRLPKSEKDFLRCAAERHTIFHFARIADYYAHSSREVQDFMERSALVLVDYDKAVENGFVFMTEELGRLVDSEK